MHALNPVLPIPVAKHIPETGHSLSKELYNVLQNAATSQKSQTQAGWEAQPLQKMLRAEVQGQQGLSHSILTAAAQGVGMGQLGKAWLAEVASFSLHILLTDAVPRKRVADGAWHRAVWVTLTGWKGVRSGTAELPSEQLRSMKGRSLGTHAGRLQDG